MPSILAAGDRFIRSALFKDSLTRVLGPDVDVHEIEFEWPDSPFGRVAEVDEASGTEEQVIAAAQGCVALVTQLAPVTSRVLDELPDLKLVAVGRGGPTNIDLDAANLRGVTVANVPGRNSVATAEMTVALALATVRRVPIAHTSMLDGRWRGDMYRADQVGSELHGATVGLIGAGAVGLRVARVMHSLGAQVLVYDPYLSPTKIAGIGDLVDEVDDLFRRSDLVSVHARLTPDTRGIVSAHRLALMRRGSYLVNAARGRLVDYAAVADAIETEHLAGVAFDVYPDEPVDFGMRLIELARDGSNIVLTPHIAGASAQTARRAAEGTAEEVRRFLAGELPLHPLTALHRKQG